MVPRQASEVGKVTYSCDQCPKVYSSKSSLNNHKKTKHHEPLPSVNVQAILDNDSNLPLDINSKSINVDCQKSQDETHDEPSDDEEDEVELTEVDLVEALEEAEIVEALLETEYNIENISEVDTVENHVENFYSTVTHVVLGGWGKVVNPCRECEAKNTIIENNVKEIKEKDKIILNRSQQTKKLLTRVTKIAKEKAIMKKKTLRVEKQNRIIEQKQKQVGFLRNHLNNQNDTKEKDNEITELQNQLEVKNQEVKNLNESLEQAANKYKSLEMNMKKENEKNEKEKHEIMLSKCDSDEGYARLIKEKKRMEEKERILLNTFDALQKVDKILEAPYAKSSDLEVIDATGEDEAGGTTSEIFECDQCNYKTSMNLRLEQHKKDKHKAKLKERKNDNKTAENSVKIPCDLCNYTSNSASDFIKHIDSHNNSDNIIPCDVCDYKGSSMEDFKTHIEAVHSEKRSIKTPPLVPTENGIWNKVYDKPPMKNKLLCLYWNRGFCRFADDTCRYTHKEIPPCRYQASCKKHDCKYYHEKKTGLFPFLGQMTNSGRPVSSPRQVNIPAGRNSPWWMEF